MASVQEAIQSMRRNIQEKTGKSVPEWVKLARNTGLKKHREILNWLKTQHRIGHSYANHIALETLKTTPGPSACDAIESIFSGPKTALRPLFDEIVKTVKTFGNDVELAPKKANVSLRRSKQFALLQPSTATRLDVGLILRGVKPGRRLEASNSFNAMFTHRVRVSEKSDIDGELKRWLEQAYKKA